MKRQVLEDKRRQAKLKKLQEEFVIGLFIMAMIFVMGGMFMYVAYDRQQKYPQYGNDLFPKTEERRRAEAEPKVYIGR